MHIRLRKHWNTFCILACLAVTATLQPLQAQCPCDSEQKVRLNLRAWAMMAGTATLRVTVGSDVIYEKAVTKGSVVYDPQLQCHRRDGAYACAEWPPSDQEAIAVEAKLDQPISVALDFVSDCTSAAFTEFGQISPGLNHITYWSRPSSKCLKVWLDKNDGQWVSEPELLTGGQGTVFRLKGVLSTSDLNVGDSTGPQAGGGQPQPDAAELTDPPAIAPSCTGGSFAAQAGAATGGDQPSGFAVLPAPLQFMGFDTTAISAGESSGEAQVSAQGSQDGPTSGNGYSVSNVIGRLRWEMSLGSVSRTLTLGRLVYQADVLDSTAYSVARLSLGAGSDPLHVVPDGGGNLRQIKLREDLGLVDIQPIANGFEARVYPQDQVGNFNGTEYLVSGSPLLTWTVDNPDGTTPLGKVRFRKTEGATTQVHLAQWQGTAQSSGTMTISRYDGKWKEVRAYSLKASPNQRVETISLYKKVDGIDVLQHKVQEVYQEFYTWGGPNDVFEAAVEREADPDGKKLKTVFSYWDDPTEPKPGNTLFEATYPDGYSERAPEHVPRGEAIPPALPVGTPLQILRPFGDNLSQRFEQTGYQEGAPTDDYDLLVWTKRYAAGVVVGYQEKRHSYEGGFWKIKTADWADESSYTREEQWLKIGTFKPVLNLHRDGTVETLYYVAGWWANEQFSDDSLPPPVGGVRALQTRVTHGSAQQQDGVAGKTTVEVTVEDQFGRVVLEESYINDGSGLASIVPERCIDRKTHAYSDGRRTSTRWNGRLVYEAGYYADGGLEWDENESGQRTEYIYDEMHRIHQKTIRGRRGDADQVFTYEYNVLGNVISEKRSAAGLETHTRWVYNLAGELESTTGPDGLTTEVETDYNNGHKVVTETLPTQATRITSYFKDRQVRSVTGTAVEDEFRSQGVVQWSTGWWREGEATFVLRDSGLTQFKSLRAVNWLGNEILFRTPQFQGTEDEVHDRYTFYDEALDGTTRQLPVVILETGRATQLFTYDELGRLTEQGFDLNGNWELDEVPLDSDPPEPITTFDRQFTYNTTDSAWEDVSTVERYLQDDSGTKSLVKRTRNRVPAALTGDEVSKAFTELPGGGPTIATVSIDRTETSPTFGDETFVLDDQERGQIWTRIQRDGLSRSETHPGISTARTYTYTALGELETVSDPVTGNLTYGYDATTRRLASVTDSLNREKTYEYFTSGVNAGRLKKVRDAANHWTYLDYRPTGQLFRQWGVNTYPVEYEYNEAGDLTKMKTFRTVPGAVNWDSATWPNPSGGDLTEWIYDDPSGLLERKRYADAGAGQKTTIYTYDSGNFLDTKVNGRNQTIDYGFNTLGQLRTVTYSDGTPSVTLAYDRGGRMKSATDAAGTHSVSWTDRDQMEEETYTAGLLAGVMVDRTYDAQFRLGRIEFKQGSTPQTRERFVYDSLSWLDYIINETPDGLTPLHKFDYTFKAQTPFVESVAFSTLESRRGEEEDYWRLMMTQNYNRDPLGRLAGASVTLPSGPPVYGVTYQFDDLDRRFEANLADGTKWSYGYNDRSEVNSGKRKFTSGTFVGGQQFEYGFDDIGNRLVARSGGDGSGANLSESAYNPANALNQLTSRTVPGSIWLTGEAPETLTLLGAVDGQPFDIQRQEGGRFFGEAEVDNQTAPVFARVTVAGKEGAALADFQTGHEYVPRNPEVFVYDDDGNLTSDGRWSYEWDAENRLKVLRSLAGSPAPERRIEFAYDHQGRRIRKTVWDNRNNGQGTELSDTLFVYDGWNLLAELDANAGNAKLRTYVWGLDLSGSMQGGGGVGGLLAVNDATDGAHFYGYDGNGNVVGLVSAAGVEITAHYEYGPFGEVIRASGPMAKASRFRFSTKYQDDETDLVYYGYRYYDARNGGWLSRDPMEESGGFGLYGFVANAPLDQYDFMGLWVVYDKLAGKEPINKIYSLKEVVNILSPQDSVSRVFKAGLQQIASAVAPASFKIHSYSSLIENGDPMCSCVYLDITVEGDLNKTKDAIGSVANKASKAVGLRPLDLKPYGGDLSTTGFIKIKDCKGYTKAQFEKEGLSGQIDIDAWLGHNYSVKAMDQAVLNNVKLAGFRSGVGLTVTLNRPAITEIGDYLQIKLGATMHLKAGAEESVIGKEPFRQVAIDRIWQGYVQIIPNLSFSQ
jgi:RHS repeat-associated protein